MGNIEEHKRFILDKLGEEELKVFTERGVDIEAAITKQLEEQERQSERLGAQAEFGTINDIMTSELVYKSTTPGDVYGKEFARRLGLLGFNENQIENLYQTESLILSVVDSLAEERKQPWVRRYFIRPDSTPETIPKAGELTISELILITDDANSAMVRDHHVLKGPAYQALCIAAANRFYAEAKYALAFQHRAEKFGWSQPQTAAFITNECLLTERLKWGNHEKPVWTQETCELKQYER